MTLSEPLGLAVPKVTLEAWGPTDSFIYPFSKIELGFLSLASESVIKTGYKILDYNILHKILFNFLPTSNNTKKKSKTSMIFPSLNVIYYSCLDS